MLHDGPHNSSRSGLDAWLLLYPLPNIKYIYIYMFCCHRSDFIINSSSNSKEGLRRIDLKDTPRI